MLAGKGHSWESWGLFQAWVLGLLILSSCLPDRAKDMGSLAFLNLAGPHLSTALGSGAFAFVSSSPISGFSIGASQTVHLVFSNSVVPGSCQQNGSLGSADLTYNGSIVSVSPVSSWNAGFGESLELSGCTEAGSGATADANLAFQVGSSQMFISPLGSDGNPGTAAAPKLTVNGALNACAGPCTILASQGTYQPESVNLPASFALVGGFNSGFTARNPQTRPTIFQDTSMNAGSPGAPTYALLISGASLAVLQGVEFQASGSAVAVYATGLWVNGGSVVMDTVTARGCTGPCTSILAGNAVYMDGNANLLIASSTLDGGACATTASLCTTSGLTDGAGTLQSLGISSSTITGGISSGASYGLLLNLAKGSSSSIEDSTISGGTSSNPSGVYLNSFQGTIQWNVISGGSISASGGSAYGVVIIGIFQSLYSNVIFGGSAGKGTGTTTAIQASGSAATGAIYNNLIDAGNPGTGQTAIGLRISGNAAPDIENNIFTGSPQAGANNCIWQSGSTPVSNLLNNGFYNCDPAARTGGTSYDSICGGSLSTAGCGNSFPASAGNSGNVISQTYPGWVAQDYLSLSLDYHFRVDGTALCAFTRGGLVLSSSDDDLDHMARTTDQGWSMGPFEYDGICE